jgi:hypothetical protein
MDTTYEQVLTHITPDFQIGVNYHDEFAVYVNLANGKQYIDDYVRETPIAVIVEKIS